MKEHTDDQLREARGICHALSYFAIPFWIAICFVWYCLS